MKVVVYGTGPACMACRGTERLLTRSGVPYEKVHLPDHPDKAEQFREMGHAEAPVVEVYENDELVDRWSGLRDSKVEAWFRRG